VLAADVRFEGFTQSDWARVLSLFRPKATAGKERDPERPRGGIVAVHAEGRLRKLLHTQAGRLRLDDVVAQWPLTPQELAARHHASWALTVESGALENVMERFGARLRRGDDLTAQAVLFATLLRDEMVTGRIAFHPARLSGVPIPAPGMIERTLDAVCPRDHAIVLGLFDAGELWTSLALRRGASGGFDWIVGPDEIRRDMGLLAGDWRRDYRHLARAIDRRIGKLALGVFAEMSTFRSLEVDPTPGAWARAVAIRDVILSPVPLALTIPLGIDAGRAAVSALAGIADRAEGVALMSPVVGLVRGAFHQVASVASLLVEDRADGGLEFDPLEILRRLLARDR
jgi:hypothetical protein